VINRPLDRELWVRGTHAQGEAIEFSHTLGPDLASLHPCKVYDESGEMFQGVGKYCIEFGPGQAAGKLVWTRPVSITNNPGPSLSPDLTVDDQGTVHIVWAQDSSPSQMQSVYYASKPVGQAWSVPSLLRWFQYGGNEPRIASDGFGTLYVCWYEFGMLLVSGVQTSRVRQLVKP